MSRPAFHVLQRALLALALVATLTTCRGKFLPGGSSSTPVFIISVDTLRSDHLPAYGYHGVATPSLDALRADSILYQRAYSHVPLTLPSHTTIMTGLLPADNGVRDNVGFNLDPKEPTLAELLKKNGYATGAAVSAFVLRHDSGISRGFDFYDDEVEPIGATAVIGRVQRPGVDTVKVAEKWLDQQTGKPVFFFLHLYEPHTPYDPPEPYKSKYKLAYDGEIAYVDQIVGDFLSYLKGRGLYDKSLIIFLSDHGEGLNEHREEEHGIFLYREALQVPLFVKLPHAEKAGATVDAPVQLSDVFPTVIEETATKAPVEKQSTAKSLLASLRSGDEKREIYSETYYPKIHFGWSDLHSMIEGPDHFIRAPRPELYDLSKDPGEKQNVLESERRAYVRLRDAIEPYVRDASTPSHVDPEDAKKLAALGYIGSTVETSPNEKLADPKDTIEVFNQIRLAFTWFKAEQNDKALALTNKLLEDNGRITDLWDLKSQILAKMGRNEEAIEAAKSGLRTSPSAVALMFAVANLSLLTHHLDDAQQHAELALKLEPARAHETLARIWVQRGDLAKARQEALASVDASPNDPVNGLMTLSLIDKSKGDLPAALQDLDRAGEFIARRRNQLIPNYHLYRGDVLARLGRNPEAEREFRQEIAEYSTQPDAYSSLIVLLTAQGRTDEATKLVFDLIKGAPYPRSYIAVAETLKAIGDDRGSLYWAVEGLHRWPTNRELRALLRPAPARQAAKG